MERKILAGSIIAVAILIGVSFTSVVGYQSTSRTIAEASPLFTVRSSRALDVDSKDLSYNYVGKGEDISISILKRDNKIVLIQKFIDSISKMDDKTLNRLIELVVSHKNKDNKITNENTKMVLQFIRESPEIMGLTTDFDFCTIDDKWFPGCLTLNLLLFIAADIFTFIWVFFLLFLNKQHPSIIPTCQHDTNFCCDY